MAQSVSIIGAGLAGSECALVLAGRGIPVTLCEMRPSQMTPAHTSGLCAELVCSNSLKSQNTATAAGLLKSELEALGSPLLSCAQRHRLPAGDALAVDRRAFSAEVTRLIRKHDLIRYVEGEITSIPEGPVVVAAGPLCSPGLFAALGAYFREDVRHFYDAAAPIVSADSLDMSRIFVQSRAHRDSGAVAGTSGSGVGTSGSGVGTSGSDAGTGTGLKGRTSVRSDSASGSSSGSGDYLNCPMDKATYETFVRELLGARRVLHRDFESRELFSACQPVEEVARSGPDALRFGALKPIGLTDPATGRRPWAVVQLRSETLDKSCYNLVGFQTNLSFGEQKRVFSLIPGLEQAEFLRFGVMHKNSFVAAPRCLDRSFAIPNTGIRLAGQITGTEGYTEAIASGHLAALNTLADLEGLPRVDLPEYTAFGSLCRWATDPKTKDYQPMHVNFGLFPPLDDPPRQKKLKRELLAIRAREAMIAFIAARRDLFG